MLKKVFQELDRWMVAENKERRELGGVGIPATQIRILGQMALIEARVDLDLFATLDVDAYLEVGVVRQKLAELLKKEGMVLDPDAAKIWMPEETEYSDFFQGKLLEAKLAKVDFVMLSKALKAPTKNAALLAQFLAQGPSERFQELAEKYQLDVEQFL